MPKGIYPDFKPGASPKVPAGGKPTGADWGAKGVEQGDDAGTPKHSGVPGPWSGSSITGEFKR